MMAGAYLMSPELLLSAPYKFSFYRTVEEHVPHGHILIRGELVTLKGNCGAD